MTLTIAARNDDYLPRLKKSLAVLGEFCKRHNFGPDVILVEWNPPQDRPSLAAELRASQIGCCFYTRIITVSPEIHRSIAGADVLPFFEYMAKNVGIRRARDGYVLTTNADDIFSSEMVQQLATNSWDENCFYRANRHDTEIGSGRGSNADEIIADCAAHVWRVVKHYDGAGGDFMLMHKNRWATMHGHPELVSADTIDTYTIELAKLRGMSEVVFDGPIYHQGHESQREGWASLYCSMGPSVGCDMKENDGPWGLEDVDLPEITI